MKTLLQLLIRLYQKTISPDHSWLRHVFPGGFCRFTPTCSMYTHMAIGKYGAIRGTLKGFWRILRCNPWSKGGLDLPLILIVISPLLLFAGCQKPVETREVLTPESQTETPVEVPVDRANFFSSPIFDTPNDDFWGTLYEEIFPYHVDDLLVWQEEIEGDWNKTAEQLETDYPDFDPLLLLKEHPEVLVQNFTSYKGENMVDLETVQRIQALWGKLDDFESVAEMWTPSKTAQPIPMPEGFPFPEAFPSTYLDNGESLENLWSELMYVDLNTWEKTEETKWKSSYKYESSVYYSDNFLTNFKLLPQDEGFLLLNEISFDMQSGGTFIQEAYQIYSYDSAGRFQEALLVKKDPGVTYEESIFAYEQAFYNEEGRLEEFRTSMVNLASNQLSMPRLIYTHERYVAR